MQYSSYPHAAVLCRLKHGTCTGLSQPMYFAAAISLLGQLKGEFMLQPSLKHLPREDAEELFGGKGMSTLQCTDKRVTSERFRS